MMRRSDRQHQEIDMDKVRSKHMAAYMFPQLNLEDLCDGSLAMRLLYERGRNHPGYFARMVDLQRVRRCEAMGVLEEARMKVTPYLVNMTTDWNEYGKIVSMADFPLSEHAKGDKTGRWMLYEGLQVLQMQHHILSFLLALSKGILHDMPDPLAASYPVLKHTVHPPDDKLGKWCAAAGLAVDSQYHTPGRIYLYRVHDLVQARLSDAQDHAWSLREDPKYFADYTTEWAVHSGEVVDQHAILDPQGGGRRPTEGDHPFKKQAFWDKMTLQVLNDQYQQLFIWQSLLERLRYIGELRLLYRDKKASKASKPTHPNLLWAVKSLQYWAREEALSYLRGQVSRLCWNSPPMVAWINRQGIETQLQKGTQQKPDDFFWLLWLELLETMGMDHKARSPIHPVDRAAELTRLVNTESKEAARLTPLATNAIVDLGLLTQMISLLDVFDADGNTAVDNMFDGFEHSEKEVKKSLEQWFSEITAPLRDLWKATLPKTRRGDVACVVRFGQDADPTHGKFQYPAHKQRSQQNVKAMQTAEANLDALWNKYDRYLQKSIAKSSYEALREYLPEGTLQRTPDWVEAEETVKPQPAKPITNPAVAPVPFIFPGLSGQDSEPSSPILALPKTKVKTRKADATGQENVAVEAEPEETPEAPVFALKTREMRVFTSLFHQPSLKDAPSSEIPWDEFLAAMRAIGFDARKVYGSVWRFSPPTSGVLVAQNPINFHEPHPNGKLSFWHARRFGRRLNRAYGLDSASFVSKA